MTKIDVVIDRSKWRTGSFGQHQTGVGSTQLLNNEGYMCCLGFICGVLGHDIKASYEPFCLSAEIPDLATEEGDWEDEIKYCNTELADKAMVINDDPKTSPEEKELKVLELFEDSAYNLSFVGDFTRNVPN